MTRIISISVILLMALLSSCSSGEKSDGGGSNEGAESTTSDLGGQFDMMPIEETPKTATPAPPRITKPETAAGLAEAFRSQNEDRYLMMARQALGQNPNDVQALSVMGLHHYKKNQMGAAKFFFSRALRQAPQSAELHNNMALISLVEKEESEAIGLLQKAVELNPRVAAPQANLGYLLLRANDVDRAVPLLETAIRNGQRDVRTLTNLSIGLMAQDKVQAARIAVDDALKIESNHREALLQSAHLLIRKEQKAREGLEILSRLRYLNPGPDLEKRMNDLENFGKAAIK